MQVIQQNKHQYTDHDKLLIRYLSSVSLFSGISESKLRLIGRSLKNKRVEAGTDLLQQGKPAKAVYLIKEGFVDILVNEDRVAQRGSMESIGEMSCLSGEDSASATARAIVDCTVWEIRRETFIRIVESIPELRAKMYHLLSSRLQQLSHRFSEILKHIPHGIVKIDLQGNITDEFSSRCIDYFGVTQLTGKNLGEMLFPDDRHLRTRWSNAIDGLFGQKTKVTDAIKAFPREVSYRHPDGETRIFELLYHNTLDKQDHITGLDIGFVDVTQQRYYKSQLSSFQSMVLNMERLLLMFESQTGIIVQETITHSKLGQLHFPSWKHLKGKSLFATLLKEREKKELEHLNRWLNMLNEPFATEAMSADELINLAPVFAFETFTGDVMELSFSVGNQKDAAYNEVLCRFDLIQTKKEEEQPVYSTMELMEEITSAQEEYGTGLVEALNEMQVSMEIVQSQMTTPYDLAINSQEIARTIHSIKGLGQSFGLSVIANASHRLEEVLAAVLQNGQSPVVTNQLLDSFKSLLSLLVVSKSLCESEKIKDVGMIRSRKNDIPVPQEQFKRLKNELKEIIRQLGETPPDKDHKDRLLRFQHNFAVVEQMKPSTIFPRLKRIVNDIADLLNKKIEFSIVEKSTALLSFNNGHVLNACLIQLVKNAVFHGIESPEERRFLGKQEKARIDVNIQRIGNTLSVSVQDDGRGINLSKTAQRAVVLGMVDAERSQQLLEEGRQAEIIEWIWSQGFSTSEAVSLSAGRGMGLSMVKSEIEGIGGKVFLETIEGSQTRFDLRIPVVEVQYSIKASSK